MILKPCPFCGNKDITYGKTNKSGDLVEWTLVCICGECQSESFIWNERFYEKEIESLKRELEQQRFNNKHNLSIDQKVADKIESLKEMIREARELDAEVAHIINANYLRLAWFEKKNEWLKKTENI